MLKVLRAKLHGIRVTSSALNYHGSISLDPEHCALAGIYPLEFVEIWNKNSGQRLSTYVIYGEPGSRCCVLNGAAARTCQDGDELIICAHDLVASPDELNSRRPNVLIFDAENRIQEMLCYSVEGSAGKFSFQILKQELPKKG